MRVAVVTRFARRSHRIDEVGCSVGVVTRGAVRRYHFRKAVLVVLVVIRNARSPAVLFTCVFKCRGIVEIPEYHHLPHQIRQRQFIIQEDVTYLPLGIVVQFAIYVGEFVVA